MKHFIAILLLIVSIQSFGQFDKGDMALGGTTMITTQSGPTRNDMTFENQSYNVAPRFGVFVKPDLELGTQITFSSSRFTLWAPNSSYYYKNRLWAVGVYAQKYFPIAEKFMITVAASISYGAGTNMSRSSDGTSITNQEYNQSAVTAAVGPTLTFLPSAHWGLQLNFGSLSYSFENNETNSNGSKFNLNYGAGFGLGIVYYFRKAKVTGSGS